jgi:F-box-like
MIRRPNTISFRSPFTLDLPLDILPPILAHLSDRRDWHACALVSRIFNRIATPLLYRTLDSRVISKVSTFPFKDRKLG